MLGLSTLDGLELHISVGVSMTDIEAIIYAVVPYQHFYLFDILILLCPTTTITSIKAHLAYPVSHIKRLDSLVKCRMDELA